MDAIKLLKRDHDAVKDLFKQYEDAGDKAYKKKESLFQEIRKELAVHAQIEEEIFYPRMKELRSEEAKDTVREAIEEHAIMKLLIGELEGMSSEEEQFDAKVKVLKENTEHHADEEEDEMFKVAKDKLKKEELESLGEQMSARKEALAADFA